MFRKSLILFLLPLYLTLTVISINAATYFTANLTGAQEVPASGSAATGFGRVTLNDAENQITVSIYYGNPNALVGSVTAGHIHGAAGTGVSGPAIFDLNPVAGATSGSVVNATFPVDSTQVADLKAGLWYFNVHTSNFPLGEIRGQILVDSPFIAYIDNNQENPPTGSTAKGSGFVSLNEATNQAIITLNWSGLSGNASGGHLYLGRVGTNGSAVCDLTPLAAPSGSVVDKLLYT